MKTVLLDVSELEAPKPLIEAAKALQKLKEGEVLLFRHRMNPKHLFNEIKAQKMEYEILKDIPNEFEMKIWRSDVRGT